MWKYYFSFSKNLFRLDVNRYPFIFDSVCEDACLLIQSFISLMPGGNNKVTHTYANLKLSASGLFKYM